jgi:hypothetical protein
MKYNQHSQLIIINKNENTKSVSALTTVSIQYKSKLIKFDIYIAFHDFSILKFKTKYNQHVD